MTINQRKVNPHVQEKKSFLTMYNTKNVNPILYIVLRLYSLLSAEYCTLAIPKILCGQLISHFKLQLHNHGHPIQCFFIKNEGNATRYNLDASVQLHKQVPYKAQRQKVKAFTLCKNITGCYCSICNAYC